MLQIKVGGAPQGIKYVALVVSARDMTGHSPTLLLRSFYITHSKR